MGAAILQYKAPETVAAVTLYSYRQEQVVTKPDRAAVDLRERRWLSLTVGRSMQPAWISEEWKGASMLCLFGTAYAVRHLRSRSPTTVNGMIPRGSHPSPS
jgi:hypothetical protein